jgi:hypothetical protein
MMILPLTVFGLVHQSVSAKDSAMQSRAGGIALQRCDGVEMKSEDIFISRDQSGGSGWSLIRAAPMFSTAFVATTPPRFRLHSLKW